MDKESLKYVLAQATTRPLPEVTRRSLTLPADSPKVVTLVGIRRSGKTYLLPTFLRRIPELPADRARTLLAAL